MFSATGQRWGNPLYNWDEMEKDDYYWWRERIRFIAKAVDIIRIDHFRGFEAFWEIPASEPTAMIGKWVKGPDAKFFSTVEKYLGKLPIIAEDLGVITQEVEDLKYGFYFPGMVIMQYNFAVDEVVGNSMSPKCERNAVAYTGTHDNDTTRGWYEKTLQEDPKSIAFAKKCMNLAENCSAEEFCWAFIEYVYACNSNTAIVPLQDLLFLGNEARMNMPGSFGGNWEWRCPKGALTKALAKRMAILVEKYQR
jgi:4-alpha-glucanotransferase